MGTMLEALIAATGVEGYMHESQMELLFGLVNGVELYIEIGSFRGRSTKLAACAATGRVIAIDHFAGATGEHELEWMAADPDANKAIFEKNLAAEIESGLGLHALD